MNKKTKKLNQSEAIMLAGDFTAGNILLKLSHYVPRYEVEGTAGKWNAPTIQHLADELHLGRNAVSRAMNKLAEAGLIEKFTKPYRGIKRVYWRVLPADELLRKHASDVIEKSMPCASMQQAVPPKEASYKEQKKDKNIERNRHMPDYRGLRIKTMLSAPTRGAGQTTQTFSGEEPGMRIGPREPPLPYNPTSMEVEEARVEADKLTERRGWDSAKRMEFLRLYSLRKARERFRKVGSVEADFKGLSLSERKPSE